MEKSFAQPNLKNKADRYDHFLDLFASLIRDQTHKISVLANTCAALREAFGFFWVGFYLVENNELILGPFQGSIACYNIQKGHGVCGTAWAKKQTIIVPDVTQFCGHIACSSLSRSEIVVPIIIQDKVKGVLDIDSDQLNAFDNIDKNYLEKIVQLVSQNIFTI